jgi:dipeptide/tripeptide permease
MTDASEVDVSHAAAGPSPQSRSLSIDAGRLWAGGVACAVVAALAVVVAYLIIDRILDIRIVEPPSFGLGWSVLARWIGWAVVASLAATALIHLLALTTPRPRAFFGWIVTLATVAAAAWAFTTSADMNSKVASAAIVVVLGIIIGSLVMATAARTIRPAQPGTDPMA